MIENFLLLVKKIPRQYYFPLVVASLGVIFFAYGLIQYFSSPHAQQEEITQANTAKVDSVKTVKNIQVDVEGAVFHTGVYVLSQDSRVKDALIAAGGLSDSADRDFVAKHINLAGRLVDGGKIYIPRVGESVLDGASTVQTDGAGPVSFIDINSASADILDSLPGVGPTIAQKIVTNRPYASINELLTKKVVGQKVFDQIKDKIIVE